MIKRVLEIFSNYIIELENSKTYFYGYNYTNGMRSLIDITDMTHYPIYDGTLDEPVICAIYLVDGGNRTNVLCSELVIYTDNALNVYKEFQEKIVITCSKSYVPTMFKEMEGCVIPSYILNNKVLSSNILFTLNESSEITEVKELSKSERDAINAILL